MNPTITPIRRSIRRVLVLASLALASLAGQAAPALGDAADH